MNKEKKIVYQVFENQLFQPGLHLIRTVIINPQVIKFCKPQFGDTPIFL